MYFSIITFSLLLLQGVLASPVAEGPLPPLSPQPPAAAAAPQEDEAAASSSLGRRTPGFGDIPFPLFPKRNFGNNKMGSNKNKNTNDKSNCPTTTNTQTNACSGGNPYCCSSDGNGGKEKTPRKGKRRKDPCSADFVLFVVLHRPYLLQHDGLQPENHMLQQQQRRAYSPAPE